MPLVSGTAQDSAAAVAKAIDVLSESSAGGFSSARVISLVEGAGRVLLAFHSDSFHK